MYNGVTEDSNVYRESEMVKQYVADTGVTIDFVNETDRDNTRLNLILASGDFPDMFWVSGAFPQVVEAAKGGALAKLNELAEKYAPNYLDTAFNIYTSAVLAARLEFDSMDIYKANLYTIPKDKFNDPIVVKNFSTVQVIKEIYEEMGSPKLNSSDDLLALLRKVKAAYPKSVPAHPYRYNFLDEFGSPTLVFANYPNAGLSAKVVDLSGKKWFSCR